MTPSAPASRAGDAVVDAGWRRVGEVVGAEEGYLLVEPGAPFQHEVPIPRRLVAGYQDGVVHLHGRWADAAAGGTGFAGAGWGHEIDPS